MEKMKLEWELFKKLVGWNVTERWDGYYYVEVALEPELSSSGVCREAIRETITKEEYELLSRKD